MAEPIKLPMHLVSVDDQGRVVIEDPKLAAQMRQALLETDENRATGNFDLMSNSGCINVLSRC